VVQKSNRCEDCHRAVPASLQRGSTPLESRPTDTGGVQTATEFTNQPGNGHFLSRHWSEECQQVRSSRYDPWRCSASKRVPAPQWRLKPLAKRPRESSQCCAGGSLAPYRSLALSIAYASSKCSERRNEGVQGQAAVLFSDQGSTHLRQKQTPQLRPKWAGNSDSSE
jgi:hypothetical protein